MKIFGVLIAIKKKLADNLISCLNYLIYITLFSKWNRVLLLIFVAISLLFSFNAL